MTTAGANATTPQAFFSALTRRVSPFEAALDFTMKVRPGDEPASELLYSLGAGAAVYGDPDGRYAAFLARSEQDYPAQLWFFWNGTPGDYARTRVVPVPRRHRDPVRPRVPRQVREAAKMVHGS
ncbi:hypothetical protein B0F90DRAFT_1745180 [Multifurca ochricompacta]|uniref:Uncharacterized protein n=1 Tax=Multifurca ochricompacta TaxID=376703 RepID=A0AAD4M0D2_9AGAM|nr:hypothetical protein B0F90DRAFT_1745180 [Multifurca ochricompacta]